MWKALLETCVLRAVRINNFFEKRVRVVLSPDVDGILSTVLLSEYLWTRHGVTTEIVGTYNGRHVRTVNGATAKDLRNCLWVDLDVRFTHVAHSIGQHFLGPLTVRTAAGAFNPNVLFQVEKMAEKYPFGTAHLVLFGLCPEIADRADGIAKALLCHADSCFWVCGKYRKNAQRWAERMFPNHPMVESLMSGEYETSHADAHEAFVDTIRSLVYRGKEQACATEQWQRCTGHQTVRANNPFVLFKNVNALAKAFSNMLGTKAPVTHDPETATTVWEGTKIRVEPSAMTRNLEAYMQAFQIRSHAVTGGNVISMTQGPPLLLDDAEEERLY